MKWANPFVTQDLDRIRAKAYYEARLKLVEDMLRELAGKPWTGDGDGSGDGKGSGKGSGEVCNQGLGTSLDYDYYCAPREVRRVR